MIAISRDTLVFHQPGSRECAIVFFSFLSVCLITSDCDQGLEIRIQTFQVGKPLHGSLSIVFLQVIPWVQGFYRIVIAQAGEAFLRDGCFGWVYLHYC